MREALHVILGNTDDEPLQSSLQELEQLMSIMNVVDAPIQATAQVTFVQLIVHVMFTTIAIVLL